jgi:hypothetical protein
MNTNLGKRHKQAVQVLNTVDYDSDGNPVGLKEDSTNPLSANFGTEREPLRGGCYKGDGVGSYVILPIDSHIGLTSGASFCFWIKWDGNTSWQTIIGGGKQLDEYAIRHEGNTLRLQVCNTYRESSIKLSSTDWQLISVIIKAGATTSDDIDIYHNLEKSDLFYRDGYFVQSLNDESEYTRFGDKLIGASLSLGYDTSFIFDLRFFDREIEIEDIKKIINHDYIGDEIYKYNCSEHSGDTCYDSSGNGNHGQIINAITTTPEENSNSIHQYQDVYSFENEEGYSYGLKEFGYGYRLNWKTYVQVRDDSINTSILHNVEVDGLDLSFDIFCGKYIQGQNQKYLIYFATPIGQTLQIRISPDGYVQVVSIIKDPDIVIKQYYSNSIVDDSKPHNVRILYNPGSGLSIFIDNKEDAVFSISQLCNNENIRFLSIGLLAGALGDHALLKNINLQNVFEYKCNESTGTVAVDSSGNGNDGVIYYLSDYFHFNAETIIPKNCSTKLPPFKDVLGNNLQYKGKVPGKAKFVQSNCFQGDGNAYLKVSNSLSYSDELLLKGSCYLTTASNIQLLCGKYNGAGESNFDFAIWQSSTDDGSIRFLVRNNSSVGWSVYVPEILNEVVHFECHVKAGKKVKLTVNGITAESATVFSGNILNTSSRSFMIGVHTVYFIDDAIWNIQMYDKTNKTGLIGWWPLCEPITDPSNHTYYDVSGNGNHATLVNGTDANEGKQDEFHYLQKGFSGTATPLRLYPNRNNDPYTTGQKPILVLTENTIDRIVWTFDQDANTIAYEASVKQTIPNNYTRKEGNIYKISLRIRYSQDIGWSNNSILLRSSYSGYELSNEAINFPTNEPNTWHYIDAFLTDNGQHLEFTFPFVSLRMYADGGSATGVTIELENLSLDYVGPVYPILSDGSADIRGNAIETLQDGQSFLNTGTKLQPYDYPALKQADKDNDFWYDADGNPRQTEFGKFKNENPINSKYYFGKNQYSTDDNIVGLTNITTYSKPLNSKQDNTEKQVRNVFETTSKWLLKSGQWDDNGIWDDKAYFDIKD